ncbi:MAG: hypothetical protein A49_29020 [Methyloceanibacter sp.]|nr:MAG: hypothetical protein A49_29020 [Methyloceanibacter sp.]
MVYALTWLPKVLRDAGLNVAEQSGWKTRGHGNMGAVKGVMCHHTVGPLTGNMPSLNVITNGRRGLSGPLAQIGLGRDGTCYVVAAAAPTTPEAETGKAIRAAIPTSSVSRRKIPATTEAQKRTPGPKSNWMRISVAPQPS